MWIDQDPEIAFDRGALLFELTEVTYDTTGVLWNASVDIFNAGIIPLWNAASFYVAEPFIVLLLEIFSQLFMRRHWQGVFSEDDFPYMGLDCTASPKAAQWCGERARTRARAARTHPPGAHHRARASQVGTSTTLRSSIRPTGHRTLPKSRRPTKAAASTTRRAKTSRSESRPRDG